MCRGVADWVTTSLTFSMTYTRKSVTATIGATMKSANIPHLYSRNGIYYYRNNSTWKSLRTRCKKEAFRKLSITLFGTTPAEKDTSLTVDNTSVTSHDTKLTPNNTTSKLIKDYLAENGTRWCAREFTRIKNSLAVLPSLLL